MKHGWLGTLAIAGSSLVLVAVAPSHAQTTGVGPYYATPSWDQTLPVATRFIVLSNLNSAAVLDRETGLVWQRSPDDFAMTAAQAHDQCNRLAVGNRFGWRLPTAAELSSLLDNSTTSPSLPSGHPFQNVQTALGASFYWTTTNDLRFPGNAYQVDFRIPEVVSSGGTPAGFAWCVRGGQGASTQ